MRELRFGIWVVALSIVGYGCDNGHGDDHDAGPRDSGVHVMEDAGHHPVDSGTPRDSGSTITDGGGGGGRCGPTGGACDISDPSSCGTGMACYLNGDGAGGIITQCFPAGTGLDGTACDPTTAGECAEGFGCSGDESVCRRWCCSDADCNVGSGTGQLCNKFSGAGPDDLHLAGICVQPDGCDVVAQSGCDAGEACNTFSLGTTICDAAGTATEGQECAARDACVAGFACVGAAGEPGHCRKYCDMTAATPCPDGFTCGGLADAPDGVGICNPT